MKNADLYFRIKNPLDANNLFIKCLDTFEIGSLSHNFNKFDKIKDSYIFNKEEYNKLHTRIFNKWKKTLITRTKIEWLQLIEKGVINEDIFALVECLKKFPDALTYNDILDYIGYINQMGLDNLLQKYGDGEHCFTSTNTGIYINSSCITASRDKEMKIEHRLYFNVPGSYRHYFVNILIDECQAHNLPYYIKIFENEDRADNVILYCETSTLLEYISLLNQMEVKYEKLINKLLSPSVLTGKINDWIGYGAEPKQQWNSYSGFREWALGLSTQTLYKEWVKDSSSSEFIYKDRKISFGEYLARQLGLISNQECKVNLDILNIESESCIYVTTDMIIDACNKWVLDATNSKYGIGDFELETLQLSKEQSDILNETFQNLVINYFKNIAKDNKSLKEKFLNILNKYCEKYNLDRNNICFNDDSLELLRAEDKRREQSDLEKTSLPLQKTKIRLCDGNIDYFTRLQNQGEQIMKKREERRQDFTKRREQRRAEAIERIEQRRVEETERIKRERKRRNEEAKQKYSYRGVIEPMNLQSAERRPGRRR